MDNRRLYNDIFNDWKKFSSKMNFNLNATRNSEITSGGKYKYLKFEVTDKENNFKISQHFTQFDFWLDYIQQPHTLTLEFEKLIIGNISISIWRKDLFERIFKRNRIWTGNQLFDSAFSVKSNPIDLAEYLFKDYEIQNLLLEDIFLVLNVNTENDILKIQLKSMQKSYYSAEELEMYFTQLKRIVDRISKI